MKSKFVADGPQRVARAKRAGLQKAIAEKYAGGLARAGFFRRWTLRFFMWRELRKAESSPYSLWLRH